VGLEDVEKPTVGARYPWWAFLVADDIRPEDRVGTPEQIAELQSQVDHLKAEGLPWRRTHMEMVRLLRRKNPLPKDRVSVQLRQAKTAEQEMFRAKQQITKMLDDTDAAPLILELVGLAKRGLIPKMEKDIASRDEKRSDKAADMLYDLLMAIYNKQQRQISPAKYPVRKIVNANFPSEGDKS
jgi:hypothetical protein